MTKKTKTMAIIFLSIILILNIFLGTEIYIMFPIAAITGFLIGRLVYNY